MKIIAEKEVGADLAKDLFQEIILIIEGMTEAQAIVTDQALDQEQVQIGIELGVVSVGNMII